EAADAIEGVAHDQQRPALADDFEGAGDRAVLAVVVLAEHEREFSGVQFGDRTCIMSSMTALGTRQASRWSPWMAVAAVLLGTGWGANQFPPLLLVYRSALDLGTGTLEAMFGFYALGLIPGLLLSGPLSDARGRRHVVVPAAALSL